MDQEFIEYIVKSLVGEPDKVEIKRTIDEKGVLLELTVAQEDLGRVIGKRGNTAQSMRTLLRALGTKNDARYNLKIIDPEGDQRPPRREHEDHHSGQHSGGDTHHQQAVASTSDDQAAVSQQDDNQQSASDGASRWAHLSSSNDDNSASDEPATNDDQTEEDEQTNSVVEKTRQELADLDGLDI
ncbi:KH domain-containing protein [Candidatus Saccharibacteria bacterium]|nr:KH domain-containing protein [Candidatus Saccharibacteria bacterium]